MDVVPKLMQSGQMMKVGLIKIQRKSQHFPFAPDGKMILIG